VTADKDIERPSLLRRVWLRFLHSRIGTTFVKFFAGSLVGMTISQIVLIGLYGIWGMSALPAGIIAFVAGSIPNFLINRRWAWGKKKMDTAKREVLPYAIVVGLGGLASSGLSAYFEHWIRPEVQSHFVRTVLLDIAYVASYGIFFILKFAVLDRFVFHRAPNGAMAAKEQKAAEQTTAHELT
jgi:putative flippase GtrA